jgi:hypothetical protein
VIKKRTGLDGKQYPVKPKEVQNAPVTAPESSVVKAKPTARHRLNQSRLPRRKIQPPKRILGGPEMEARHILRDFEEF